MSHQFGRYRFSKVPFRIGPLGDMFKQKIDAIFKELPNIFSIADYILIVGYDADGRDHDRILR